MARPVKGKKKKKIKVDPGGIAHIKSTFNNTIITLTDKFGNVISWGSAGCTGIKGYRKSTNISRYYEKCYINYLYQ